MGGKLTQKNGRRLAGGKPIPQSSFALPGGGPGGQDAYPIDTLKRARNALSRIAQNGTPKQKATVRRAVQQRYSQINVSTQYANQYSGTVDFAVSTARCPNCGHTVSFDFDHDGDNDAAGGGVGGTSGAKVGATPQPQADRGSTGFRPQQLGLASERQAIELASRPLVRTSSDIIIGARDEDGVTPIRHRAGGALIANLRHNDDGTWQSVLEGTKPLTPHTHQRAAVAEALSAYNTGTVTPQRPAMPLQLPPAQPELLSQMGVQNVRAFAFASGDDSDDSDDSGGGDSNGLTPRGQGIYKKLTGKGVAPKVAMAMAKRAQATKPGTFGGGS